MEYPHLDVIDSKMGDWNELEEQMSLWSEDDKARLHIIENEADEDVFLGTVKDLRPGQVLHVLIGFVDEQEPEPIGVREAEAAVCTVVEALDDFAGERKRGFAVAPVYYRRQDEDNEDDGDDGDDDDDTRLVAVVLKITRLSRPVSLAAK